MKQKNGFTLIELLAVIVILAIIALIATPIVLDIINDSRNSSQLRSADFYLDAVEYAVSQAMVDNKQVESGTYNIIEDGNICLKYKSDKVECVDILKVDVSGGVPKEGSTITIIDGQIKKINLQYEQSRIMKNQKGELAFFKNEYEIGDEITFNPGDGGKTWNVIDEDIDTITLMLNENLEESTIWYAPEANNNYGPITALNYLNISTSTTWTNVDPIDNYIYTNNKDGNTSPYGYQKLEIKEGVAKIINQDGTKVNEISNETRARLITLEEVIEIGKQINENLKEENLRAYIERNLNDMSNIFGYSLNSVDDVLTAMVELDSQNSTIPLYYRLYYIVYVSIKSNIEPTYNIDLPNFMFQNLDKNYSDEYCTLSSIYDSYYLKLDFDDFSISNRNTTDTIWVRPVITIPKSKLN